MSHENWLKKFTWYKSLFLWHIESFLCALLKIYTLQQFTLTGRAKRLPKSHVIQQWGDFNLNMRTITLTYISDFSVCLPIKIIAFTWLFFSFKFFSLDNHNFLNLCCVPGYNFFSNPELGRCAIIYLISHLLMDI